MITKEQHNILSKYWDNFLKWIPNGGSSNILMSFQKAELIPIYMSLGFVRPNVNCPVCMLDMLKALYKAYIEYVPEPDPIIEPEIIEEKPKRGRRKNSQMKSE